MPLTHVLVDFENTQPSASDVALLRGKDHRLWIFRGPGQRKYDAEFAEALMALGEQVGIVRCEKSGRNALDMHIAFQIGRLFGELAPDAQAKAAIAFVVVSRDTDYEPLLQYVRAQGYAASRVTSLAEAMGASPAAQAPAARSAKSRAAAPAAKTRASAGKAKTTAKKVAGAKVAKTAKAPAAKRTARGAARGTASGAAAAVEELVDKVVDRLRDHPRNRPTRRDRMESWLASHLRSKLAGGDVSAIVAALEKRGVLAFDGNKIEYPHWS